MQLIEVAEHPMPPYAWPGNSRGASPASGSPRDVELAKPGAGTADSRNPFAGGLPAPPPPAQPHLQRQASSGVSGSSGGGASGRLQHSGAFGAEAPDVFGGHRFIEDDDPMSPTWSMRVSTLR